MFVLLTFLTTTGLSNFYSLNPCFAAILQSINISVVLLSKSTFTITPLCISIFSTPISSYTFLSILNVLLTSLCFSPSLATLFRASIHMPLCYAFSCLGYTTSFQFYHFLFLSTLYSEYNIPFLSCSNTFHTIAFLLLHSMYSTLIILFLLASSSLQFHASWYILHHMFLIYLLRRKLCL